jgi:hypothetical protein
VHKQFVAVFAPNETKTLGFVEPFDCAGESHNLQLLKILIPLPALSRGGSTKKNGRLPPYRHVTPVSLRAPHIRLTKG